jgi:hypothetical protein
MTDDQETRASLLRGLTEVAEGKITRMDWLTEEDRPVTLAEFLLARIKEDEEAWSGGSDLVTRPDFATFARHMLAECEAKRLIIEHCSRTVESAGDPPGIERESIPAIEHVLKLLALPYAGHPDYRQEWRP